MKALVQKKEKAVKLRRKGYSYKEILNDVHVAKSSLSLWLKDLPLTSFEKEVLRKRKDKNISRGRIKAASVLRQNRLKREQVYLVEAKQEFQAFINNPLFHTGISIYWAEGAKRNEMFQFMNSDCDMVEIMLLWLESFTDYSRKELGYRLYLHAPYAHENWEMWWQKKLGVTVNQFKKTIVKPTQLGIKKRPNYKGCLRVEVPRSSKLLVKMKFWINMLVEHYKER